jgi:hypothetical protein
MNEDRDKFLTKAMGLCWHEALTSQHSKCIYCGRVLRWVDYKCYENFICNNYSTWDGFGRLFVFFRLDDNFPWGEFITKFFYLKNGELTLELINPNKFADAIYEFLKELKQ